MVPRLGKPGIKWLRLYKRGVANYRVKQAIKAYQNDHVNVIAKEMAAMRSFQNWHMGGNGWIDIGYHEVVFPSGHVYLARAWDTYGAHAYNGNSMPGFCIAGDYQKYRPTKEALASLKQRMAFHGVTHLTGHYKVPGNSTNCPGQYLKEAMGV